MAPELNGAASLNGAAPRRRSPVAAALLAATAALVTLWAYTGAITPGVWTFAAVAAVAAVAVSTSIVRSAAARLRAAIREPITLIVQLIALTLVMTVVLASETALFGILPTPLTLQLAGIRIEQAIEQIRTGVAPITASVPLAMLLGPAFGAVTIVLDHLIARRLVIVAIALTTGLGVVPMIISYAEINIPWFLMQAVLTLILLRYAARHDARAPREASLAVGGTVGVLAIAAALGIAPALPVLALLPGSGPPLTVNANLRLGDDLRRPQSVEVMTLVTSSASAPYLRMATLSEFDGEVWRPDRGSSQPLEEGFGAQGWEAPIRTVEATTSIRVVAMSSKRLPVPYAADSISGLDGRWQVMPENRTVITPSENANGADYTVRSSSPAPTLEQIRASSASGVDIPAPPYLPDVIGTTARDVTARQSTDYDRLLALQNWFRSEFTYSLDAPVEDGFDGTGAEAVARFLTERSGYCIHFAGAFALMAQSLDMPARIVVGYLPGVETERRRDDDIIYSISSDQLHAWPEVHFEGIGWVPFEPTATLGVPTDFIAAASVDDADDAPDAPLPSSTPTPTASTSPDDIADPGQSEALGDDGPRTANPWPTAGLILAVAVVLLLPAASRAVRRAFRRGRAARGDALSAWREVSDTMIDLGLPLRPSQTVRERASALQEERGVAVGPLRQLSDAVERTGYASAAGNGPQDDLRQALDAIVRTLRSSASAGARVRAALLPRSLVASPLTDRARTTV